MIIISAGLNGPGFFALLVSVFELVIQSTEYYIRDTGVTIRLPCIIYIHTRSTSKQRFCTTLVLDRIPEQTTELIAYFRHGAYCSFSYRDFVTEKEKKKRENNKLMQTTEVNGRAHPTISLLPEPPQRTRTRSPG